MNQIAPRFAKKVVKLYESMDWKWSRFPVSDDKWRVPNEMDIRDQVFALGIKTINNYMKSKEPEDYSSGGIRVDVTDALVSVQFVYQDTIFRR